MRPVYWRDGDCWYFKSSGGEATYYVSGPDSPEPRWERIDSPELVDCLPPDAEPATPTAEDLEQFERVRVAYGIGS